MNETYKYWFKVGTLKVHCGITTNLERRADQHRASGKYKTHKGQRYYWKDGHIVQEGRATTRTASLQWERENGCSDNWN